MSGERRKTSSPTKPEQPPENPPVEIPPAPPILPPKPPTGTPVLDGRIEGEYTRKFLDAKIRNDAKSEVEWAYHLLTKYKNRYTSVAARMENQMPWWIVGAIHMLESDFDFTTHLHNGDPLTSRTKNVPAGRPVKGTPPFTWEESAVDALFYDGADKIKKWDLDTTLAWCERYNGLGYKNRGVPSPYIWSFTNQYEKGRFVADGRYDPNSVSKQVGVAAVLKYMEQAGDIIIRIPSEIPGEKPETPLSATPWLDIAKKELGVHEKTGGENPRIIEYHSHTTLQATEDEVPWCASFLCFCLDSAGYSTTQSAWAQSFALYGEKLKGPKIGCIVPFRWSSTSGHVGICVGFGEEYVDILGGNQSDPNSGGSVSVKRFGLDSVMGYRWPVKKGQS